MDSFTLVIFGFTSNLAQIKLIPTLYDLVAGTYLQGTTFRIVGIGRTPMDTTELDAFVHRVAALGANEALGVAGLHLFTFNQVAATEAWRARLLAA